MSIERGSLWKVKKKEREILPVGEALILPPETPWKQIKKPVIEVFDSAFSATFDGDRITRTHRKMIEKEFKTPENTIVVQKNIVGEIIGWTYANPIGIFDPSRTSDTETAYIGDSVLYPEYQGQKIIWKTLQKLEDALREKGYTHMERRALQKRPGWPNAIKKHYGERIVDTQNEPATTFFRIKL